MRSSHRATAVACLQLLAIQVAVASTGPPRGKGSYEDFTTLFGEFRAAQLPSAWNANFNDPASPDHGLMDYGRGAMEARLANLEKLRARLDDLDVASWPRERQSLLHL